MAAELGCQPVAADLDCLAARTQLGCQPMRSEPDPLPRPAGLDCLQPSAELDPLRVQFRVSLKNGFGHLATHGTDARQFLQ